MYYVEITTYPAREVTKVPHTNYKAAINYALGASAVADIMWSAHKLTRHSSVNGVISHGDNYLDLYDELTIKITKD